MATRASSKIIKLEDIIKSNDASKKNTDKQTDVIPKQKSNRIAKKETTSTVIKGKPKSGRIWKSTRTRFSSIVKSKGNRNSFEHKETLRKDLTRIREVSRSLIAAQKEEKEQKKEKKRETLKRQAENRKKSEVVQVITNTSKLKKMKKKQLRNIEKRDTN